MMRQDDKESADIAQRITAIMLDESSLTARTSAHEHERQVAVNDMIEWNHFALKEGSGPYTLTLKTAENRIALVLSSASLAKPVTIALPLAAFRGVIRDYFLICESYFEAVKTGNIARIEAVDMSRRGVHDEGARLLISLLEDRVEMDSETARRLFTLLSVLHMK